MTPLQFWIIGATAVALIACLLLSAFYIWDTNTRYASEIALRARDREILIAALERVLHQHDLMSGHPTDESCYSNNCPISVDHVRLILEGEKE